MISAVLFISFFIFLLFGVPIGICLGLSSVCAILYSGTSLTIVATNMYSGISKFLLLAIPFFVLSGNIMAKAGISKRLIRFVNTCVGHRRGGIAIVCVIVACFFGAISGSGPATVAALGSVLIPAMIADGGFSAPFSTALMATASSIAIVIPPSIAFVVYASISGVSIADMFTAGIVPGLLMGAVLVIVVMLEARTHHIKPQQKKAGYGERWEAFKDAFWGFLMPVIILGGIYGGIFTPTEAAAVSVVYGLFVGMVIYREVTVKDLWDIVIDSAKTTGGIMLIVACASLFSFVCTQFGIAQAASDLLGSIAHNQFTFLLIVNIIFLIAGCFIDANSAMYIFIPIMLPVCRNLGYDLVAFGVVATVNLAIGQVTPPVGVNLFVAISVKLKDGLSVTIQQISRAVISMIVACLIVLAAISYIPSISTFLPKWMAGDTYTGTVTASSQGSANLNTTADFDTIDDHSDLGWAEQTWNFACSTTETSTWAEGGRKFGELMEKASGGKIKVNVYAADQLTGGNQSEGIQALMNGDPVQVSMHSNLIYSAFDPRFNVVSLPYLFDSVEDADAKLDGAAGEAMKEILKEYGLHCMGIAENGFRQLTNNVREIKSVEDMKNLKIRVAGSNLLMECYKRWGADATNMNWSETYTALQQRTVEGQENPLPAIDAASVQEVQPYVSMWNANYDCLFFCINEKLYESLTPEQQAVVDEAGRKAVAYERYINRAGDDEIKSRWTEKNGVKITPYEELDIASFKAAVADIPAWFEKELEGQGYADAKELIETFTSDVSAADFEVEDHSDLGWSEQTWNFACSTTETSTWADGGRKFGELVEKATGGKIKVNVYASDQLTNGNQSEGIQALMDGDPVQVSMHSNLIYSAFDPRFNVVSMPYLFDSVEDADAKLDGEAGERMKEILESYGLHCMGIAENGFRQLTNNVRAITSVADMKNLKIRVAGSNLLMECYKRWGADATNMNWSETYTALQQKTVEGQENPLPAIDAASVQEVQPYCSLWNANYDCLFFCINQKIYDSLTPEQQAVIDECGQKATEYQRYINRAGDDEIMSRWTEKNGVSFTSYEDMDIDSFKAAVADIPQWFEKELENQGYSDAKELIEVFTAKAPASGEKGFVMEDHSSLGWNEQTWNFACSTTETSTWAEAGRKFGELVESATGGKIKVNVYAADQLTGGNQSEGIQALIDGDPVQVSMHSNLIYSAFDPRFNAVSLPYLFDSVEDADRKLDGEAGDMMKAILNEYGLHCMGIAENGFRQLTNNVREIRSVDDMKNLKIRVAGSNLLMECYKRWGADATNMNWSETYTALQQKTVEGQENPLPAIDAASVQEVQPYVSMWNANYDCLFFCINQGVYDSLTPEQQKVIDECGRLATEYQRYINRAGDDEIMSRWTQKNGVSFLAYDELDIDSFKHAVEGIDEWFIGKLAEQNYTDGEALVAAFRK
ncbi:DctP family TRAP transporter solute-binding subunit [Lacrimispora sp. 210928-DFI.3.58]|uniref:DctP family TRAP transporter solute-binding subunit n=1 Tax=Lacrimispora sp. 210928-DFI.3.58 TaxID=2883214 RepID=UPI001D07D31E|nr:DctP family TRAP transporter solute-binding subunit [Lacrimispora sp. 210928-DFI.3.58]MCB7320398.1 DctP family TRAP transporter solute-binding subunit [Lacrimispora sp. 210928-DFI.3.58]